MHMRGPRHQKQEHMYRSIDKLDTWRGQVKRDNHRGKAEQSHCLGLWEEPRVIGEKLTPVKGFRPELGANPRFGDLTTSSTWRFRRSNPP
eukprot:g29937.t1